MPFCFSETTYKTGSRFKRNTEYQKVWEGNDNSNFKNLPEKISSGGAVGRVSIKFYWHLRATPHFTSSLHALSREMATHLRSAWEIVTPVGCCPWVAGHDWNDSAAQQQWVVFQGPKERAHFLKIYIEAPLKKQIKYYSKCKLPTVSAHTIKRAHKWWSSELLC